jgi:hypothetical protein
MLRASSWLRVFVASALLLGLVTRAEAWHILHRCRDSACASQTVQIPAQQVVVETARPRVVVRDTRPIYGTALAAPPVVASFFVPMPLQVGTLGVPAPSGAEERESVTLDFSGLQAAHDLERSHARVAALQAIHDAQAKQIQAALERVAASTRESAQPAAARPALSTQCCDELKTQLQNLSRRVEALEQQVNYHDRAIRKDPTLKIPEPPK